jgi:hypothetical protein
MDTHKLLEEAYIKLNLDFKIGSSEHLYIYNIHRDHFSDLDSTEYGYYVKTNGLNKFYCSNIYEALLWYCFFKCKYKHFLHYSRKHIVDIGGRMKLKAIAHAWDCKNKSYFSRIPLSYKNMKPKKGLSTIKKILDRIIVTHNGIPEYYHANVMHDILYIK